MKRLLLVLALLPLCARTHAWGFSAHRVVNRQAIATLPPPLRSPFEQNADFLAEHSIDPDLWRGAGVAGEEPNHFLDLDAFGSYPFGAIPHDEAEHLRRHGAEAVAKGRAPWRIAEVYGDLVRAFGARDPGRVLELAATLGHYVGDVHVPLHAVLNYDGQLTSQKGVHERWESDLFERFERQLVPQLSPAAAVARRDPVELGFEALLESFRDAAPLLAADKADAGPRDYADTPYDDRYGNAYYTALFEGEERRLVARLQRASERIGALWLGAWEEAGRPELPRFRFPYVRGRARLVLVTIDGAPAPIIDDAVRRGVMPNLARLRASGAASVAGSLTALPVKTPSGHAALYTGAWSDRNGIAGIEVTVPGENVLTAVSGYTTEMLRAEPLWVTAARQGLDAAVLSATQTWPFAPFQEEKRFGGNYARRLTLFDGYQDRRTSPAAFTGKDLRLGPAAGWRGTLPPHHGALKEFEIAAAGTQLAALVYDDPADPIDGFDSLYVTTGKQTGTGVVLKPSPPKASAEAFQGLTVRTEAGSFGLHLRLYSLAPDGSDLLLVMAEGSIIHSNRTVLEGAALRATGGFVGNGADDLYKDGGLGPPIWQGGDGTAEARYLETAHLVERQFRRIMDFGLDATKWDVLVGYLPFPDEQLHLWYGHLDPSLRGHDPEIARRLAPFLDRALALADAYVGHLLDRLPANTILAVGTDHGMGAANRTVAFNVALQRAGLLTLAADGEIDLSRTQAVYFPGNSSYFLINRVGRQEGSVHPEEEPQVLDRLKAVLRAIRDPETGEPVVTAILDPRDPGNEPAIGGPIGGDLYVDLAPGYYSSSTLRGEVVSVRHPSGEHLFGPQRAELRGAFALAGEGVARGVELGPIRQIDIAPTLSALLGIAPPAQSQGSVLRKALERDESVVAAR